MELYRALGDVQFACDFLIGKVLEGVQHFLFAATEICDGFGLQAAPLLVSIESTKPDSTERGTQKPPCETRGSARASWSRASA